MKRNRQFRIIPGVVLLLALVTMFGACESYQSKKDFSKARERAGKSEAESQKVITELRQKIKEMPPEMQAEAVKTIAQIKGEPARKALLDLMDSPDLNPQERDAALDALIKRDEPKTPGSLLEKAAKNPELLSRKKVLNYLDLKEPQKTPKVLAENIQKNPTLLNDEYAKYLGDKKFTPAIPLLHDGIKNNRSSAACMTALNKMESDESDILLVAMARDKDHPGHKQAVSLVMASERPTLRKASDKMVDSILKNAENESEETVRVAIERVGRSKPDRSRYASLQAIYLKSKSPELRTRALGSLAKINRVDPYLMARDLHLPLIDYQARMALWTPDEANKPKPVVYTGRGSNSGKAGSKKRKDPNSPFYDEPNSGKKLRPVKRVRRLPGEKVKPVKKANTVKKTSKVKRKNVVKRPTRVRKKKRVAVVRKRTRPTRKARTRFRLARRGDYPRSAKAYKDKFYRYLLSVMLPSDATRIYKKLNNAIRAYSESESPSGQFILRSYKKEFGKSEEQRRSLLKRGLSHPGSLSAILLNVHREYRSESMRAYALGELFALPRWQAQLLLGFVRR